MAIENNKQPTVPPSTNHNHHHHHSNNHSNNNNHNNNNNNIISTPPTTTTSSSNSNNNSRELIIKQNPPVTSPHPFSCTGSEESCLHSFLILRQTEEGNIIEVWAHPLPLTLIETQYPKLTQFVFNSGTAYSVEDLSHTFVLTDGHGVRVYGHCTVFVNSEATVSLSPYPWCHFFTRLALLFRTNGYESGKEFVKALRKCPTPPSGGSFIISSNISIHFRRPYDRLCTFIDTSPLDLFSIFPDTSTLFSILADLLLEKHIIVVGPNFGLVSNVVMSLQALISPFDWMHILIPILPSSLIDVLAAPPPYLVGILTSQLPLIHSVPIERVVIIHLGSSGKCEGVEYFCEEKHILPNSGTLSALRIGYFMLKMRDPRDQSVTDLCSLFMTYYANLLGNIGVGGTKDQIKLLKNKQDIPFYETLLSTQCYNTLMGAVQEALADKDHSWMDNEFIVALVRGHSSVYPEHYKQLIYEENNGGGFAARYENCFGSREEFTGLSAAVHGFGGHRMGTGRLLCHFLRSCVMCISQNEEDHRAMVTIEASGASIAQGNYNSAPLFTPEIVEMKQITIKNGMK